MPKRCWISWSISCLVILATNVWQGQQLTYPIDIRIDNMMIPLSSHPSNVIPIVEDTATNTNTYTYTNVTVNITTQQSSSPFAYVFMAFGCDPGNIGNRNQTHNPGYRPYIANMLVATEILRQQGSQADVIAMFKFKYPDLSVLPPSDEDMLHALGIQIRYIPHTPEWYSAERKHFLVGVLNKIHILNLTEYQRVLFLDGDVLPLANLDYLMELSYRGDWQETVVLSTSRVPMIAGIFVVTPNTALYQHVYRIVNDKIVRDQVPRKKFDPIQGWGHVWDPNTDGSLLWQSNRDNGTLWDYYAANGDQGIFYYYPRYLRESLTQILAGEVLHFGTNGTQWKTKSLRSLASSSSSSWTFDVPNCQRWINNHSEGCRPPYSDHAHFTHPLSKPWQVPAPPRRRTPISALDLWWQTLYQLQDRYSSIRVEQLLPNMEKEYEKQ